MHGNLRDLGRMIAEANLPRAASQGYLGPPSPNLVDKPSLSKSDVFLERSPSPLVEGGAVHQNTGAKLFFFSPQQYNKGHSHP